MSLQESRNLINLILNNLPEDSFVCSVKSKCCLIKIVDASSRTKRSWRSILTGDTSYHDSFKNTLLRCFYSPRVYTYNAFLVSQLSFMYSSLLLASTDSGPAYTGNTLDGIDEVLYEKKSCSLLLQISRQLSVLSPVSSRLLKHSSWHVWHR